MFDVENGKSSTLLPLIIENIPTPSTIISDKFSTYVNIRRDESRLDPYGYTHYWVNHSKTFVDEFQPFINTNSIERSWRSLRNSISTIKRTFAPTILEHYLNTFIMRSMMKENELYELLLTIMRSLKEIIKN